MAKYLSDKAVFWFGGYDLGADTTLAEMAAMARDLESTTLTQSAEKVVVGPYGGEFTHEGILDDAANQINAGGAALIGTAPAVTVAVEDVQGRRSFSAAVYQAGFKTPASVGGIQLARLEGVTDGRVGVGKVLNVKETVTSNGSSSSLDNSAASSNGALGFLHVFASDGTADFVIEESSDDGAGDAFATVLTFTQITSGISSQRIAITGSVERYLRRTVTLGTATSVTFAITIARL